jgi:hypothetical protein
MKCEAAWSNREYALALEILGKTRKALRYAQKSSEIARQQEAHYELAQSRVVVAELSKKLGLANADRLLTEARDGMAPFARMIEDNVARFGQRPSTNESS